ncbi:restriction endonuclease subunit S [Nocardiopsis sp. M1B1]|uniref:restriction endonuclease subunit S n=1 Tax=Nocardiopsis sp. M1B1 TaxID=3450454 RepID=UPI00403955FA
MRLRHAAQVNPSSPAFDRLPGDADISFIRMESVWPGKWAELSEIRKKSDVVTGFTRFQDGDVLVPKITPTFEASRSIFVNGLRSGVGAGTTELHVIRPTGVLDARFLSYIMHSCPFLCMGEAEMYGVAGQKRVPDDFVRNFEVWVPGLGEQRKIADFLDSEVFRIDQMLSAAQGVRDLLEEKRSGTIFHEVTGAYEGVGRRESGLDWAPTIPDVWDVVPLKYVAKLGSGHTPSRTRVDYWKNCSIPWISLFDVGRMRDSRQESLSDTRQMISEVGMENSSACLHPAGTVVLSRTASVGFSTIMGRDMAVSQHFVTWTCGNRLDPYYLLYVLRSMGQYFKSVQVGTTNVTIFMPDLFSIKIPLPSVSNQRKIVGGIRSKLHKIDSLLESVERQIDLLEERKRALITAAVTGQIDVTTARGADVS